MLATFFTPLGARLFGGLSLVLLIAVAVLGFKLHGRDKQIDHLTLELRAVTAERDRFRDAGETMVREGQARSQAAQEALRQQEAASATLKRQIGRIHPRNGGSTDCKTDPEVMAGETY